MWVDGYKILMFRREVLGWYVNLFIIKLYKDIEIMIKDLIV